MAPFYGWGSTASRREAHRGGSLLFTTKFPELPGISLKFPEIPGISLHASKFTKMNYFTHIFQVF